MAESLEHCWPLLAGAIVCSAMVALTTTSMAYIEFNHAGWTRSPHTLPAIAEAFRSVYLAGWILPILSALVGTVFAIKKVTSRTAIASAVALLAVGHLAWFLFTLLALYLTNQTLVGAI